MWPSPRYRPSKWLYEASSTGRHGELITYVCSHAHRTRSTAPCVYNRPRLVLSGDWSNGEDGGLQNRKSGFDSLVPRSEPRDIARMRRRHGTSSGAHGDAVKAGAVAARLDWIDLCSPPDPDRRTRAGPHRPGGMLQRRGGSTRISLPRFSICAIAQAFSICAYV
jgi:hypothetical protein